MRNRNTYFEGRAPAAEELNGIVKAFAEFHPEAFAMITSGRFTSNGGAVKTTAAHLGGVVDPAMRRTYSDGSLLGSGSGMDRVAAAMKLPTPAPAVLPTRN